MAVWPEGGAEQEGVPSADEAEEEDEAEVAAILLPLAVTTCSDEAGRRSSTMLSS
jgi:hypothetical protein